ncbi:uncharacterized protein LOC115885657, partial [Sitophilus oryzae]|uniref:Uncharacterized protein LOC115885657 n=1 Tax=Sitophilus oryzae TaxID=7048 RepID=A0A6J2YC53_SITOR
MEETVDGTSEDVLAAATREAAYLTDKEREAILAVLTKDEQLRRQQQVKVLHLKAELQSLRRKGALKVSEDSYQDPDRTCGRCRADLGRVINRGASCTSCRLKVCKACREYNFRATDWVCTVCYKRMEIQAASGEWMNEFVRRPSRRRDARVYVPAADIIKRTIRRSWTISNPSPRWTALRTSPELRPYNSLPRGQDISNYPSLLGIRSTDTPRRSSPQRRTKSEDVYHENKDNPGEDQIPKRPVRVNPLMSISLRETKEEKARRKSPRAETVVEVVVENEDKTKEEQESHLRDNPVKCNPSRAEDEPDKVLERHVSFDSSKPGPDLASFRSRSLSQSKSNKDMKKVPFTTRSLPEESTIKDENEDGVGCGDQNPSAATNAPPAELLCDIEPISGTVFRKMTVRRRRQENMRKLPAVDAGWRRPPDPDLQDILLPDGEDYRLVFVNSDGSSKEEEVDDNDSSSASSFPIDDCDWDYFEPGAAAKSHPAIGWTSPFGSPTVFRKRGAVGDSPLGSPLLHRRPRASSDEDGPPSESPANPLGTPPLCLHRSAIGRQQTVRTSHPTTASTCCKTCGGNSGAQYIPIPVPVPIPFPVPWNNQGSTGGEVKVPLYRPMPDLGARGAEFWQYLSQMPGFPWGFLEKPMIGEKEGEDKGKSGDEEGVENEEEDNRGEEEEEPRGHLECENRGSSASESSSTDSSADEGDRPRVRRVYNVTGPPSTRESDDALPSSEVSSDDDAKSSADEQEREEEAEDEDDTSSGSADTDSNDTGTVADQKPRHFSRVFVVNHKDSSGSVTSSNGDTDSSDNDTDLELDCSVVLTNIKQIDSEENVEEDGNNDEVVGGGASFLGIRYLGEDEESRRPVKEIRRRSRARRKGKKSKVEENIESETEEEEVKLAKELEKEPSSSKVDLEEADKVAEEGASFLDIGHLAENEENKKPIKETRRKSRTRRKSKNSKVEENNKSETEEIEVKLAKGLEKKPSSSNADSEENIDDDERIEEGASFLGTRHL